MIDGSIYKGSDGEIINSILAWTFLKGVSLGNCLAKGLRNGFID